MDVVRNIIEHDIPRRKLDSGKFQKMRIGLPFAIAFKLGLEINKFLPLQERFEFETLPSYNLLQQIFLGVDEQSQKNNEKSVTPINPNSNMRNWQQNQYFQCQSFGRKGFIFQTHELLLSVMKEPSNPQKNLQCQCESQSRQTKGNFKNLFGRLKENYESVIQLLQTYNQ